MHAPPYQVNPKCLLKRFRLFPQFSLVFRERERERERDREIERERDRERERERERERLVKFLFI